MMLTARRLRMSGMIVVGTEMDDLFGTKKEEGRGGFAGDAKRRKRGNAPRVYNQFQPCAETVPIHSNVRK